MPSVFAQRQILPNGIRLVTENVYTFRSVTVGVLIERGSKNDPIGKKGLAHFVEHLLVRKAKNALAQLDSFGGWFEAYTERECTFYYVRLLDTFLSEAFTILSKLVNEKKITDDDCEQEKGVVLNEIEMYREDYSQINQQALIEKMWSGHPLSHSIIGDSKSIRRFDSKDIISFIENNYIAPNIIISVVGSKISHSAIGDMVVNKFRTRNGSGKKSDKVNIKSPIKKRGHYHIDIGDSSNIVYYSIGINSLHRMHPDRVVLFALSSLLAEGLNSRLFQKLRLERGYTYDIQSSYQLFYEGGILTISGMSNNKTLHRVIRDIEMELKYLANRLPSDHEIAIVKNRLKSNLIFNLENPELRMIRLAKLESWFRRTFDIVEELEMIEAVSGKKIWDLVISLLKNGANLCTIGNKNDIKDLSWTL